MKNYCLGLFCLMTACSFLNAGQLLYTCADENSIMTFSESSFSGQPIFTYVGNDGDTVSIGGDGLRVRRELNNLLIVAAITDHPRFAVASASFPMIEADSGTVYTIVRFTNAAGMPIQGHRYDCDVKRVAF